MLFWSLVFPIILAIFFKLALGNIDQKTKFSVIPVAVNQELLEDKNFNYFMEELEKEEIFKIKKVTASYDFSQEDDKEIIAYIKNEDQVAFKSSGALESIVQIILERYEQQKSMILTILKENPQANIMEIIDAKSKARNHVEESSQGDMNLINTFFYTLIGMQLMYGYSWGLFVSYQYEANLSTTAKRNAMAPIKKSVSLFASVCVAFLINFIIVILTMLMISLVLKVDFSDEWGALLLLTLIGSATGVFFGMLLGVSTKANIGVKTGLGIGITMFLSYLAGMMDAGVKISIQESMPIVNQLNPVALITDAIYALYYYPTKERFYGNILSLSLLTLVFFIVTLLLMRRRQYDSL